MRWIGDPSDKLPFMWFGLFLQYWEKAEFPFEVVPHIASLKIGGGSIKVLIRKFICCFNWPLINFF